VKQKIPKQFCQATLKLDINLAKSLANLVMSLASFIEAQSVVELSLSPKYHYSSISDAINGLCHLEKDFAYVN
jgi:hypothetical protein